MIEDKVATVDWSAEVLEGSGGARVEELAIQSIVYTLTEFPTISSVRFTVEGKARVKRRTAARSRTSGDTSASQVSR